MIKILRKLVVENFRRLYKEQFPKPPANVVLNYERPHKDQEKGENDHSH